MEYGSVNNILALDLATKTGYCIDGKEHGVLKFKAKTRYEELYHWLDDLMRGIDGPVKLVVYEKVRRHIGTAAAHVYGGFQAVVIMICNKYDIELIPIDVGTIKKTFTGNGRAKKQQIIDECKKRGYEPEDDNAADAIAIYHTYKEIY